MEDAFERDIEQALMLSMIEAEHDKEIAREREAAKAAIPKWVTSLKKKPPSKNPIYNKTRGHEQLCLSQKENLPK